MNFSGINIVFICGTLEHGRDGVGDYTIRLAGELARRGNRVALVSINDRFVNDSFDGFIFDTDTPLSCLRLSKNLSATQKIHLSKSFINICKPHWVSLQYVPYSFNSKGTHVGLSSFLKSIARNVRWHIMFHELWTGTHGVRDLKSLLLKVFQKVLIKTFIIKLKPALLTTSIRKYQLLLENYKPHLLPLFGNIPVINRSANSNNRHLITVVIYGTVTQCLGDFNKQLLWLKNLSQQLNKNIRFVFIGNNGPYKSYADKMISNLFDVHSITTFGFVDKEIISQQLMNANIAISRADSSYLGKSGTTITMLEHGLPVLLKGNRPQNQEERESLPFINQLLYSDDPVPSVLFKFERSNLIEAVADKFLNIISGDSNK